MKSDKIGKTMRLYEKRLKASQQRLCSQTTSCFYLLWMGRQCDIRPTHAHGISLPSHRCTHITSHHITSHHITSHHITARHATSPHGRHTTCNCLFATLPLPERKAGASYVTPAPTPHSPDHQLGDHASRVAAEDGLDLREW